MDIGSEYVKNLMWLVRELGLAVNYKVYEFKKDVAEGNGTSRDFLIILQALHDRVFKMYGKEATANDLPFFRGLFLKASLVPDLSSLEKVQVQQAFLPKFENESQDAEIAETIVKESGDRFMVITIKHSGSLITMSADTFGAKNSIDNEFTACGMLLVNEHFKRAWGSDAGAQGERLFSELRDRRMSLSFELCTGALGHHGQLPAGDYLVTTSASFTDASGRFCFLPWQEFLSFCVEFRLPINDTWIIAGADNAREIRDVLDRASLAGTCTSDIISQLDTAAASSSDSIRIPGTYPHDEWQGTRIEGFVVSQGQSITSQLIKELQALGVALTASVIHISSVAHPKILHLSQGMEGFDTAVERMTSECAPFFPHPAFQQTDEDEKKAVLQSFFTVSGEAIVSNSGHSMVSRAALSSKDAKQLSDILEEMECAQSLELHSLVGENVTLAQKHVFKALAGQPDTTPGLRYKKKMMLFSDQHIGYCMMTFIIRNGLRKLRLSQDSYLTYVRNLVQQWKLTYENQDKCLYFAESWAEWVETHDILAEIEESKYLDHAEQFVRAFLAGDCLGRSGSCQTKFQGIIVAIGTSSEFVTGLKEELQLSKLYTGWGSRKNLLRFKTSLVEGGCLIHVDNDSLGTIPWDFLKESAPYLFCVHKPLPFPFEPSFSDPPPKEYKYNAGDNAEPATKKLLGMWNKMYSTCYESIAGQDTALSLAEKIFRIDDDTTSSEIANKLGDGLKVPERDPGYVVTFVGIPGIGKSSIIDGIDVADKTDVYLQVLSSDKEKAAGKNGKWFWPSVAELATTTRGDGKATIVLADKNLLNHPIGQFGKVASILAGADVMTIAVVPTVEIATDETMDEYSCNRSTSIVPSALPLELFALAMLRVMSRCNHAGGLDGDIKNSLTIVASFCSTFYGKSREDLLQELGEVFDGVLEIPLIMDTTSVKQHHALAAVLEHLEKILKEMNESSKGLGKRGRDAEEEGTDVNSIWEEEMRRLLDADEVKEALETLQLPLVDIQGMLKEKLFSLVDNNQAGRSRKQQSSITKLPIYIAVSDLDEDLVKRTAASVLPEGSIETMKGDLHITLWHRHSSSRDEAFKLLELGSQEVRFLITHIDCSPQVTAARVEILDGIPFDLQQIYLHITLIVAEGSAPVDANRLPQRIIDSGDEAVTIPLTAPVSLVGKIASVL